jgi:hypothetical protein
MHQLAKLFLAVSLKISAEGGTIGKYFPKVKVPTTN